MPGWAEKQTPTPFLYHKHNLKQLITADSAIKNAKYSLISGASKVKMPEAEANLTIKKLGDANGDGDVTEADVNAVAKHIMGSTPEVFDEEAADVNGDQEINAADIVEIVKIIK